MFVQKFHEPAPRDGCNSAVAYAESIDFRKLSGNQSPETQYLACTGVAQEHGVPPEWQRDKNLTRTDDYELIKIFPMPDKSCSGLPKFFRFAFTKQRYQLR